MSSRNKLITITVITTLLILLPVALCKIIQFHTGESWAAIMPRTSTVYNGKVYIYSAYQGPKEPTTYLLIINGDIIEKVIELYHEPSTSIYVRDVDIINDKIYLTDIHKIIVLKLSDYSKIKSYTFTDYVTDVFNISNTVYVLLVTSSGIPKLRNLETGNEIDLSTCMITPIDGERGKFFIHDVETSKDKIFIAYRANNVEYVTILDKSLNCLKTIKVPEVKGAYWCDLAVCKDCNFIALSPWGKVVIINYVTGKKWVFNLLNGELYSTFIKYNDRNVLIVAGAKNPKFESSDNVTFFVFVIDEDEPIFIQSVTYKFNENSIIGYQCRKNCLTHVDNVLYFITERLLTTDKALKIENIEKKFINLKSLSINVYQVHEINKTGGYGVAAVVLIDDVEKIVKPNVKFIITRVEVTQSEVITYVRNLGTIDNYAIIEVYVDDVLKNSTKVLIKNGEEVKVVLKVNVDFSKEHEVTVKVLDLLGYVHSTYSKTVTPTVFTLPTWLIILVVVIAVIVVIAVVVGRRLISHG